MKKLLLFTGAVYGIYMLIKKLNLSGSNHLPASGETGTRARFTDGGRRIGSKAKAHHGDIRGIMKKASTIGHSLVDET